MSFEVRLYTLSKRDNSTKRPAANTGTAFDCVLKHGSGILHPSLSFDIGINNDPSQYNYAYIPAWDRYYFIEEWFFDRSLWTATLKVDVLATYKTEIGNSSLYILRAAGAHNGSIVDNLYPCKTGCTFDNEIKNNPWNTTPVPVIGVIGKGGVFGSMNYYALDPASTELSTLLGHLLTPQDIINTGNEFNDLDASYALQLSLVDPIQYIKTCVMIPVALADISAIDAAAGIDVYSWNFSTGRKIHPASRIYKNYSFTLKKHPDTSVRGNYVNSAPYTKITLTIPPYGCIDIDTSVTCNASTLDVDVEIDPTSGKGILVVKCNNIVLNRLEAQIGVPVSLSSVTRDYIGAASSALGAVGGIVGGIGGALAGSAGAAVGGFAGAASSIGNAIEAIQPRAQTIGSTGSFVANRGDFRLDYQFMRPVDDDNIHNGRPLCEVRQINSLSGYMLIQDGDVAINGTSAEDALVRNYLETGFYYE